MFIDLAISATCSGNSRLITCALNFSLNKKINSSEVVNITHNFLDRFMLGWKLSCCKNSFSSLEHRTASFRIISTKTGIDMIITGLKNNC